MSFDETSRQTQTGASTVSTQKLRVLIANQRSDRLGRLADVVEGLGHEVVAREITVDLVAGLTARERPDLALVGLGRSSKHALALISEIVREAFCPVIAVLASPDPEWVERAADCGVYAYIVETTPEELQSTMAITLRRFAEYQNLQGAFERREEARAREQENARVGQRMALAVHDSVVQGLSVAHLALELDRKDQTREAIQQALGDAQKIVTRALADLEAGHLSLHQLISDAAPRSDGI